MRIALLATTLTCTLACNNSPNTPPDAPMVVGAGFGSSCASEPCRAGLTCGSMMTCGVAMPAENGRACFIGKECASGQCAPNGVRGRCVEVGTAGPGTSCQGDADCAGGLRCSFSGIGLVPTCVTPGTKDIGAACTASRECLQGLLCQAAKCAYLPLEPSQAPKGVPPLIVPPPAAQWQGASCPARKTSGPITALWNLPRESDPADVRQDFFRLPFPNDAHRVNGRVDFSRFPKDPAPFFGFDLLGRYLERLADEPFGNFPVVTFRFDGGEDLHASQGTSRRQLRTGRVRLVGRDARNDSPALQGDSGPNRGRTEPAPVATLAVHGRWERRDCDESPDFPVPRRLDSGLPRPGYCYLPGITCIRGGLTDSCVVVNRVVRNDARFRPMLHEGAIDFASIGLGGMDPQLRFVDLTEGMRFGQGRGLSYLVSAGRNRYVCHDWFALKPYIGDSLPAGTYAVIMKKGLKDTAGADVQPSPDFTAMLATTMPSDATLARAWQAYAPLRRYVAAQNLSTADLLTASLFTVGDATALVKSLADSVAAAPPVTASGWVKCPQSSPCKDFSLDGGALVACSTSSLVDVWYGQLSVPVFQQGTTPYLTPAEGGDIVSGDGGVRVPVRTESVCASLTVPKGAPPDAGWPLVVYAHGTGGSFDSHAFDGTGALLADVTLADGGATAFAVLGFDQVGHGTRRGARQDVHPNDIVFNFGNPASARGTMAQGAADLFAVTRWAKGLSSSDGGLPVPLDPSHLGFWGHSQGASEGGLFLAFDRSLEVAVLTGASGSLADSLTSKKAPVNIADGLALALGEPPGPVSPFHPVVGLLASWTDPVDALHFARRSAVTAADGALPAHGRHVFQAWGLGDLFTPSPVQRAYAQASGAAFVGPRLEAFDPMPVDFVSGNVMTPRRLTSAVRQYEPPFTQPMPQGPKVYGYDGHFVGFQDEAAKRDIARFFGRAQRGEVPSIPGE